eukprot:3322332-Pyramimonas_sp.AAC.1
MHIIPEHTALPWRHKQSQGIHSTAITWFRLAYADPTTQEVCPPDRGVPHPAPNALVTTLQDIIPLRRKPPRGRKAFAWGWFAIANVLSLDPDQMPMVQRNRAHYAACWAVLAEALLFGWIGRDPPPTYRSLRARSVLLDARSG